MKFIPIKTRTFLPPKDEIWDVLDKLKLKDGDILVITSKILAIHQGRCIKVEPKVNKMALIKREAEYYFWSKHAMTGHKFLMTIKAGTMLSSSGIDESNANGFYVLWPKGITKLLKEIHSRLLRRNNLKRLGIIVTDSRSMPMHRGSLGVAIGFYGFKPYCDYRGQPDIFGRKLKYTQTNIVDALAITAVHMMGEGNERTPIIIVRGQKVEFTGKDYQNDFFVPLKKDLYYPLLKVFKKR